MSFFGFAYPTRMVIVKLSGGGLWVWSPVELDPELAAEVDALGPVEQIVSPNKLHHFFLAEWHRRHPEARVHAPPGLAERKPDLHFDATLGDRPDPAWNEDIDQVIFRGSLLMDEVVFFHRVSSTVIVGDLVQRHDPEVMHGVKGWLMRLDGLVGDHGSTPREWRACFLHRGPARDARDRVLAWRPERLVVAHGACAESGAESILSRALAWL